MALPSLSVREQLAREPIREVLGIVDSWGARIGRPATQELWDIKIICEPWKLCGGELRTVPLALFQQRTLAEAQAIRALIKPFEVFCVRAMLLIRGPRARPARLTRGS